MIVTTRFAPSPTGWLHLGHAHAALFAFRAAQEVGGRFLLRIEDIDATRCRPEFDDGIREDLTWLGLVWDGPVRQQSRHLDDYRDALARLDAAGLLYPCFCTRAQIAAEIAAAGSAPHPGTAALPDGPAYPGTCRDLARAEGQRRIAAGEGHALRLDVGRACARLAARGRWPLSWEDRARGPQQAQPEALGDVVLARKEIPTSYHLAVTVDDALQGVTLVTRGVDLFHATHIHRLLQALLDLPVPCWHHHHLLSGPDGRRLAKRDHAPTLRARRADGWTPAMTRAAAGMPDPAPAGISGEGPR